MITIYQFDSKRIFTGNTQEISERSGAPSGWTRTPVPEIPEGKFAMFMGNSWNIIDNYPTPPLDIIREQRREYLKQQRDSVVDAHINNVQVGRITDRENIQGTLANWDLLGLGETISWVMADNTIEQLSKADLEAVFIGYATRKFQCFALYEQVTIALNSATTVEEIMNISFPSLEEPEED